MKQRRIALSAAVVAAALVLQGGIATADDVDTLAEGVSLLPQAAAMTATDNQTWAQQNLQLVENNWSCRLELPTLVAQPEVDSRVTVKGEDTAATSSECVNLELGPDTPLTGEIWLEWLNPDTGRFEVIRDNNGFEYKQPCQLSTVKGVGVLPCPIDVVFPANHYAAYLGAVHRAGARLTSPVSRGPAYSPPVLLQHLKATL